jgi:hypothetical protein
VIIARSQLIASIQEAFRTGKMPCLRFEDFHQRTGLGMYDVHKYFDGWKEACAAAGVQSCAGPPPKRPSASPEACRSDLRRVAALVGRNTFLQREYQKQGRFSLATIRKWLGPWPIALKSAGLQPSASLLRQRPVPHIDAIADVQRVQTLLGKADPSAREYDRHGRYHSATVIKAVMGKRHSGKWLDVLAAVGARPGPGHVKRAATAVLTGEFLEYVVLHGRIPSVWRLARSTRRAVGTYSKRFGGLPRFKLAAIDGILKSGQPLPEDIRRLLELEHTRLASDRRVAAKVSSIPRTLGDRQRTSSADSVLLDSLIAKLKQDDEHTDVEAKEAFFTNTNMIIRFTHHRKCCRINGC